MYIALSFLIPSTIGVLFIIAMCVRFENLRSDYIAEPIRLNCAIKFRIILLLLDVATQLFQFSLVFFCKQCYEYKEYIAAILFINGSAIVMQIILMIYEFKKRVPSFFAHKIYWMINWIILFIIDALLFQNDYFYDLLVISLRILIISTLLIYTLFIRRQDIAEFEDLGFFNSELPDVDITDSQRPRISTLNNDSQQFINIELQKRWNIVGDQIEIKLNMYTQIVISSIIESQKNYKIKKTVNEVLQMHEQIVLECSQYFESNPNDLLQINYLISQISQSEDLLLINNIQKYLNILISKLDLFSNTLMNFIQLPQLERELLDDLKSQNRLHKSSIHKKNEQIYYKKWDLLPEYLPYVNIKITEHQNIRQNNDNHVQYTIVSELQQEVIMVQKRFREFYEFNEQLRQQGLKNLPPFPQKAMIRLTQSEIEQRQKDLEIFLKVILNDRQNHNHSFIFKFIGLNNQQEELIKQQQQQIIQVSEVISQIQIKNNGFEEAADINGDKYYRYQFSLSINNIKQYIWKRYRQFDELHSVLKHKYTVPNIPSKTQQVNPITRSAQLTQYLIDLIKIPQIGENPHLIQFFELNGFWYDNRGSGFSNIMEKLDNDSVLGHLDAMRDRFWE